MDSVIDTPARAQEVLHGEPGWDHVLLHGWVRHPLRLDVQALHHMEGLHIPSFQVVCTLDGPHGNPRPMCGVPLRRLIEQAVPDFAQRTDFKRAAVIASSRENYRALFSWNELFNTSIGEGVLLAWDCAQAPLAAGAGPFALVSLRDLATGPRYIQRLARLELVRVW